MNRIREARDELYQALAVILPDGRVTPYPRTVDVGVAVWIDEPTVQPVRGTTSSIGIDVDFPVYVTYDGADRAQVAGLDEIVAKVWDVCERLKFTSPQAARPAPPIDVNGTQRRITVVTIRRQIAARTLCLPAAPDVVQIPPDPVPELV